jgi:hypothetical protein
MLVSNYEANIVMTRLILKERVQFSAVLADEICGDANRWLTTVSPQTGAETTETAPCESSGNNIVRNKND